MLARTLQSALQRTAAVTLAFALLFSLAPRALLAQEPPSPDLPAHPFDPSMSAAAMAAVAPAVEPASDGAGDLSPVPQPEDDAVAPGAGNDSSLGATEAGGPVDGLNDLGENPALAQLMAFEAAAAPAEAPEPDFGPQEPLSCSDADCPIDAAAVDYLSVTHSRLWHQGMAGIPGGAEANDLFGSVTLSADFNGDGFDEFVVGVPYEDLGLNDVGVVYVIPGRADESPTGAFYWSQDTFGVPGVAETGDRFGSSLAAGDFDDDGWPDLAIGVPGESDGAVNQAGAVNILYGGIHGLTTAGAQLFTQQTAGIPDTSEINDGFGTTLAAGDFNGDGADDLAIGVPREPWIALVGAGQVTIIYGMLDQGLRPASAVVFSQATAGVAGAEEAGDYFGAALAVGHFNADNRADLAIGAPNEAHGALNNGGVVHILHGSATGITAAGSAFLHQDIAGILDTVEANEYYGSALAAGDRDANGRDDLFVGVPGEDYTGATDAGAVQIIQYSGGSYASVGLLISRFTTGVIGDPTNWDLLGAELDTGDFDSDGRADLVIGFPNYTVSGQALAGGVIILHRLAGPAADILTHTFTLNSLGVPGSAVTGDYLGGSVAAGDFNGDKRADLLAGLPYRDRPGANNAGSVLVLYNQRQWFALLPAARR